MAAFKPSELIKIKKILGEDYESYCDFIVLESKLNEKMEREMMAQPEKYAEFTAAVDKISTDFIGTIDPITTNEDEFEIIFTLAILEYTFTNEWYMETCKRLYKEHDVDFEKGLRSSVKLLKITLEQLKELSGGN